MTSPICDASLAVIGRAPGLFRRLFSLPGKARRDSLDDMQGSRTFTIRLTAVAAMVLLLVWCLPARGALVSASDPRFGPGTLTLDTATGLAWLDLPITAGYSYESMSAALQPGGEFAGFRYATSQEVAGLFGASGIPGTGWFPESGPVFQPITALVNLLGQTSNQDGYAEAGGVSGTWGHGGLIRPILDFVYENGVPGYDVSGFPTPAWEFGATTVSTSWLVTEIPEPNCIGLLAMGAFSLAAARRLCHSQRVLP
jgi:hypothetical protein